jgi:hypothetical protein
MTTDQHIIRIQEHLHRKADTITAAEYVYDEYLGNRKTRQHRVIVKREEFEQIAAAQKKSAIPFESFIKVTRPLLMGHNAANADISEAFQLLDFDKSETIDIYELAVFMPAIVPDSNEYMLLRHFQKADTNNDYRLNLDEFTEFIKKNIIRDLALGRL